MKSLKKTQNTGFWTFFCNPRRWDIEKYLSSGVTEGTFQITEWQKDWFEPGQKGIVRVGIDKRANSQLKEGRKLQSGIYALVEVLSKASFILPDEDKLWQREKDRGKKELRVKIRYDTNLLANPITIDTIRRDSLLNIDKYLLRGFEGSSIPLKRESFRRIVELTMHRNIKEDNSGQEHKRHYWLTTQWPQKNENGDNKPHSGIYLADGRHEVGRKVNPGDGVVIYESRSGPSLLKKDSSGNVVKIHRHPGKEGIVSLANVTSKLNEKPEKDPEEYNNGRILWWKWHVDTNKPNDAGYLPRLKVNEILGYSANYYFRGYGKNKSGLGEITKEQYENISKHFQIPEKIARICWNTNGWKYPSGTEGKSLDRHSYERSNGFGHEEWLFDKSKEWNCYHYGFLQALKVDSGVHYGKHYDIWLYSIRNSGQRYIIGRIRNVICISKHESVDVYNYYKRKKWLMAMREQVKNVGSNLQALDSASADMRFNCKFRFSDVEKLDYFQEFSKSDTNIQTTRFKLLPKVSDFTYCEVDNEEDEEHLKSTGVRKKVYKGETEYEPYHNIIQNEIYLLLRRSYKQEYRKVRIEKNWVDIEAKTHNDKYHYYEVKTDSPKNSIRQALGQIMEYAYWPDVMKAEKLIVVSDGKPDNDTIRYLKHLRSHFRIPFYYRYYNHRTKTLSDDN